MSQTQINALVQQRIKKMRQSKKKDVIKEDVQLGKRLKSNIHPDMEFSQQELAKPKSSIRLKRPVSAFKSSQSTNAIHSNIPSSQKVQIDCRGLIMTVFEHGPKLQQFLKQNHLNPQKYLQHLQDNQLFILSCLRQLKDVPEEKYSAVVEKATIKKITKELEVRAQMKKCQDAENRISQILQERIKALSNKH